MVLLSLFSASPALADVPPANVARGKRGIVVSAHPDASRAGVAVLKRGGNAMDAAIATAYALSVVEPFSAGMGGGGFLLFYDAQRKKTTVIDYREVAPKGATRDMYVVKGEVDAKASTDGIRAVAVPAMVPGLDAAQKRFGKLRLDEILDPAIELAEEGFLVTPTFYEASLARLEALRENEAAAKVYLKNKEAYPVGERLKQPDLANTLRRLKRRGARDFTHGYSARAIVRESQRLGGLLDLTDLQGVKPKFREPLVGKYRDHTVITMPPPSSGGTHLLQMLATLELDAEKRGRKRPRTATDFHVLIETMRRAYADRAVFMGDPEFVDVPVQGLLERSYLDGRYLTIDMTKASNSKAIGAGRPSGRDTPKILRGARAESKETTHLTVIDSKGNVVALTQTVNLEFGAGVVVPKTGVLLNNQMDDFAAAPGARTPTISWAAKRTASRRERSRSLR